MSIPLPAFIAVPLVAAFLLPIIGSLGKKGRTVATVLANATTISLLIMACLLV